MELPFSSAVLKVHSHATEDEQRVVEILRSILPKDVEIKKSMLEGHYGNPIVVLEARLSRKALLRELWSSIMAKLRAGELDKIKRVLSTRVDDSCHLYLRFDKQCACKGELVLTEGGDAVHLKLKVKAFPPKQGTAIKVLEKFFEASPDDEKKEKVHSISH